MLYLQIDEYDTEAEKLATIENFNMELFQFLNLENEMTKEDHEMEESIEKEIAYVSFS